jgi:hypothetical protein
MLPEEGEAEARRQVGKLKVIKGEKAKKKEIF